MKKQLPKTCLTCKYMDFVDDDLNVLHCFVPSGEWTDKGGILTSDDNTCDKYKLNQAVKADADMGMWG